MKSSNTNARTAVFGSTEFPWKWSLAELEKRPKHGHTVFSCFSCGGGSSMGYKLAGYDVVGNCEIDPDMMKVYKQNNHPKHAFLMDIRDFLKLPDEKIPEEFRGMEVIDCTGKLVIPGLVDLPRRESGKKAGTRKRFSGKVRQSRDWMTCSFIS